MLCSVTVVLAIAAECHTTDARNATAPYVKGTPKFQAAAEPPQQQPQGLELGVSRIDPGGSMSPIPPMAPIIMFMAPIAPIAPACILWPDERGPFE